MTQTDKTAGTIVAVVLLTMALLCVTAMPAAAYTYDRNAAADYAYNNAYNSVPGTWYFEYRGGDCANFVSHSLQAGGWREIKGWYKSDDVWYYDSWYPGYCSYTWSGADNLFRFMSRTSRANPCSVERYSHLLEKGDVVQMDYKDEHGNYGSWDHSMIVTGKNGDDPLMSYHSNTEEGRERDKSLSTIRQENPNVRFIAWSIHDNY